MLITFDSGHTRIFMVYSLIPQRPNAAAQARLKAGATEERTL
jgi:hypothetical protein